MAEADERLLAKSKVAAHTYLMGHILAPSFAFCAALSEDAGVRSGFALNEADLLAHLPANSPLHDGLTRDTAMRVSADDYANTVGDLLFALGTTTRPGMPSLGMRFMELLPTWRNLYTLDELLTLEAVANHYLQLRVRGAEDQAAIFQEVGERTAGKVGAMEALLKAMAFDLAYSPFFTRDVPLDDLVKLTALFESEQLPVASDQWFDQRFVNYLDSHPERLKDIHWRQFEGLAAEWFQREGYDVQLGPGRNDGSIDLRLWQPGVAPGAPPAVIVQCKRQTRKIERVVVKALYADVLAEGAGAGLVVTTSDISPGAASDIAARAYPITSANRAQVQQWISAMRKPDAGIVADDRTAQQNEPRS